ncbi:restriction system modified-DNA reader domain-containing protein [Nonomuraea wenchangensis]|uniref:restriction system modified-DNA reader domain-containing protein n=1 Tax=Nonomuraea wenchangensis TaxID=568860 RepID=UPI0037B98FAB
MREIRIDEEVYAFLQSRAKAWVEEPNDVLRRLLLEPITHEQEGALKPLLDAGLLQPQNELVWRRPRLNKVHYATVLADGRLRLEDGEIFLKPSPACKALSGQETDGWAAWRRASDLRSLKELRNEL